MKTEQQQTVTAEHRQRNAVGYVRHTVTPHFVEQTDKVAVEQTRTALHRPLLPMRAGFEPNRERYSAWAVHCTVGGVAAERLWRSRPLSRLSQRP